MSNGTIVARDRTRFAKLYPEARPVMPENASGEIKIQTIRAMIGERLRALTGPASENMP